MPAPAFTLVDSKDYYHQLLAALPKARERIVLAAMVVFWGEKTEPIFREIESALKRGVRVHILLDNYTRLSIMHPHISKPTRKIRLKKTFIVLEELRRLGATVTYFGKVGLNPYKGRCHVKVTVIDNAVYSFGGVNFSDESFVNSDYMLNAKDEDLAECLEQLITRISQSPGRLPDAEVPLDDKAAILFDGGRPKHSLIYDRACKLAVRAKKIYYFSQWSPSGTLARRLKETDTIYCFNRPEQLPVPSRYSSQFDQSRYRITNFYKGNRVIHAKFILFELKDGTKALLSGSNNFSYRGVAYGTQEIALYSTDSGLWQQLYGFFEDASATKG